MPSGPSQKLSLSAKVSFLKNVYPASRRLAPGLMPWDILNSRSPIYARGRSYPATRTSASVTRAPVIRLKLVNVAA